MRRILVIVLDGLGDQYDKSSDKKTPLEAANTPNLDCLTGMGATALIYPVREGYVPETHTGMLSLFGYDIRRYYVQRGPIEAYGYDRSFTNGDLAFRLNFATLASDGRILDRRVCRELSQAEADALSSAVNASVVLESAPCTFKVRSISTYRAILTIGSSSAELSAEITNTDPAYDITHSSDTGSMREAAYHLQECMPLDSSPEAKRTAQLVNEFISKSHLVLDRHDINQVRSGAGKKAANVFLTRDVGNRIPELPSLRAKYKLDFGYIIELPVERGVGLLAGMETIEMRLSGRYSLDCRNLARDIVKHLDTYDVLYVHVKGPDEAGHDKDCHRKRLIIEEIDKFLFGELIGAIRPLDLVFCVTADHATLCELGLHSDDAVPILVMSRGLQPDDTASFTERSCAQGKLPLKKGVDVLPFLVQQARHS